MMMKKMFCGVVALSMALAPITLSASRVQALENVSVVTEMSSEESVLELKNLLQTVEQYIEYDNGGWFNEELAYTNQESEEIIAIGQAYNIMLRDELSGNYEQNNRKKRSVLDAVYYGNWCGPGDKGRAPIDILDAQCQAHDHCYATQGRWNTGCDIAFVYNIGSNFGAINKIGWHARSYAVAAVLVFASKAGGTISIKTRFPLLGQFLP